MLKKFSGSFINLVQLKGGKWVDGTAIQFHAWPVGAVIVKILYLYIIVYMYSL